TYTPVGARGDRLPDFSNCGYRGGGVAIPDIPVRLTVAPMPNFVDATARIQAAVDEVSALPPGADGVRGAVLLTRGVYRVAGTLVIAADGVVLRGEGDTKDGTVLFASGTGKRPLISVAGPRVKTAGPAPEPVRIADAYVPVGRRSFAVAESDAFAVGDSVIVTRMVNDAWIKHIGMDKLKDLASEKRRQSTRNWEPRGYCIGYRRTVTGINGTTLTLDVPVVCAIDARWGGGSVIRRRDSFIRKVGVERLRIVSEFDRGKTAAKGKLAYFSDEEHCQAGVRFERVRDGWARDIVTVHAPTCIGLGRNVLHVTVQDCASLDPVSIISGGRRYPFGVDGQQCLLQRCYTESARHGFAYGSRIPGPNVVLDCLAVTNYGASEPHHRWATGGLFDNFSGQLLIGNRGAMGSGHGWAGAGFVAWNTEGTAAVQSPPASPNFAIGHVGKRGDGPYSRISPQGQWESHGEHVEPRSLYLAQLRARLGDRAVTGVTTETQRGGTVYTQIRTRFTTGRTWNSSCFPDWDVSYPDPWGRRLGTRPPNR
ncbi:MAG: hypothetical protein HON70_45175, partial [Lentisphaerae bacterium]|nr:hypothetical protein [Lentisphaerota bacterium]